MKNSAAGTRNTLRGKRCLLLFYKNTVVLAGAVSRGSLGRMQQYAEPDLMIHTLITRPCLYYLSLSIICAGCSFAEW